MAEVIIVDDSKIQRTQMGKFLKKLGHSTTDLKCAQDCLDYLKENDQPDCIVTDLNMPGITGADLIKSLREKEFDGSIVVVTADMQEHVVQNCLEIGANAVLLKPYRLADIKSVLEKVL